MAQARDEAGNIWEVDANGNPVRLVQAAEGRPIAPVDPSLQFEAPKASADARRAAADATVAEAEAPYAASIAQANAREAEAKAAMAARDAERGRPSLEGGAYKDALGAYYAAQQLEGTISDIEMRFKEGPGRTGFPTGAVDWFPTAANQRFDKAASGARGPAIQALGFSATQMNTPDEAKLNIGAYIPSSGDWDSTIQDTIARLKDLQRTTMQRSVAVLGGVPDANGVIRPVTEVPDEQLPNALRQTRVTEGQDNQAAGFDATTRRQDLPPEYQAAHAAFIAANPNGIDPEAYVRFRSSLDEQFNQTPDPEAYRAWANEATQVLQQGGTINLTVPGPEVQMDTLEQVRNNMATNPLGAAAIGAADMGSFGGVSALAGDQMDALREDQPIPMLAGEVAGAIGGTGMLGRLGKETLGRIIPQGKQGNQFLRDLLTDTSYGAAYGGVTEGDPLTGAAAAGLGSGLGQGVGKALGGTIGGISQSAPVQAMRDAGVRMTAAQRMGGFPKSIEDAATSMPVLGDIINARRFEGIEDLNRAAFREAGSPTGFTPSAIQGEGIDQLKGEVNRAYTDATAGVGGPLDMQFLQDFQNAASRGQGLPQDLRRSLGEVLDARVQPIADIGSMTGKDYEQAMRALKATRANPPQRFQGFEQDYRDAVTGVMDSLTGQIERIGGKEVTENLGRARALNKNTKIMEDAVLDRAKVGSQAGEPGMVVPSQLVQAARKSEKKYGPSTLKELAENAQRVLPSSLPDSGTARRGAMMVLPASMGGAAGGIGALTGGAEGAQTGATSGVAFGTLLALLGTRGGQAAINKALFERAPGTRKLGDLINRSKGLAGTAMVPLAMEDVR